MTHITPDQLIASLPEPVGKLMGEVHNQDMVLGAMSVILSIATEGIVLIPGEPEDQEDWTKNQLNWWTDRMDSHDMGLVDQMITGLRIQLLDRVQTMTEGGRTVTVELPERTPGT